MAVLDSGVGIGGGPGGRTPFPASTSNPDDEVCLVGGTGSDQDVTLMPASMGSPEAPGPTGPTGPDDSLPDWYTELVRQESAFLRNPTSPGSCTQERPG